MVGLAWDELAFAVAREKSLVLLSRVSNSSGLTKNKE
jgi:hypothetical protein